MGAVLGTLGWAIVCAGIGAATAAAVVLWLRLERAWLPYAVAGGGWGCGVLGGIAGFFIGTYLGRLANDVEEGRSHKRQATDQATRML